jgi:hypothetical protein
MAERFFLVNSDELMPFVEVRAPSLDEFGRLMRVACDNDDVLSRSTWGIAVDPDNVHMLNPMTTPPSDMSFAVTRVLVHRVLARENPIEMNPLGDPAKLRTYLRQFWGALWEV